MAASKSSDKGCLTTVAADGSVLLSKAGWHSLARRWTQMLGTQSLVNHNEERGNAMSGVALAAPILPGKVDDYREFSRELAEEPRRSDYIAVMKKSGVSRIRAWLQQGPEDAVGIILYGGETPTRFQYMGTSQEPFAVWFRGRVKDVNGLDLTEPMEGPPSELLDDFHID